MKYYLGIDGGGTNTHCYLANEEGKIVGASKTGSSTYHAIGLKKSAEEISKAINLSLLDSKLNIKNIEIACLGLSGIDSKNDFNTINKMLNKMNIAKKIILKNDSYIALIGGTGGNDQGIVLISGTGAIGFGINYKKNEKRVGGWGHILGDEGSGYSIAISGLRAAMRSYDGRIEGTQLLYMFKEKLNLKNIEELLDLIYVKKMSRNKIASLANVVFEAAKNNDKIANKIIVRAAKELSLIVKTIINELDFSEKKLDILLVGGVFKNNNKIFFDTLKKNIKKAAPKARIIRPKFSPTVGALFLAFQKDNILIDNNIKNNIRTSKKLKVIE